MLIELIKAISPLIVGLAAPFVTVWIYNRDAKGKKKTEEALQDLKVGKLMDAVKAIADQTNENTAMNHRLLNGIGVLIDSGELHGTMNGPGKQWLRETRNYCMEKGFHRIEFESLEGDVI